MRRSTRLRIGFLLLLGLIVCPAVSLAQPEVDTVAAPGSDEDYFEEQAEPQPAEPEQSVYFTTRNYQPGGGGPDSLRYRSIPDSVATATREDPAFWYVDYRFTKQQTKKEEEEKPAASKPWLEQDGVQAILWILIVSAFVAVIVLYLANSQFRLFRRASADVKLEQAEEASDTDNIFGINYQTEIDKAIARGNYRQAVRLLFLRMLRKMADRQLIRYEQDKTNFDYLMQLSQTRYYTDFFRLTRIYEYCWYGQFEVEPEQFPAIRKDYENFDQAI